MDGHGIKWHRNITENLNRLSTAYERYRRQTGGCYTGGRRHSERELAAKKRMPHLFALIDIFLSMCALLEEKV